MTKEQFVQHVTEAEKSLYRVAKSMLKNDEDCADAIQNAILHAFDKRATLKQEKYFKTWLTRILMNECYQMLRDRREQVPYEDYMEQQKGHTDSMEQSEVYQAVMELEETYRLPIILYYIEGYSVKEVASILELGVSNVKARLSRARKQLQDRLEGE